MWVEPGKICKDHQPPLHLAIVVAVVPLTVSWHVKVHALGGAKVSVIQPAKIHVRHVMVNVILVALMHALRLVGAIAPVVEDALIRVVGALDAMEIVLVAREGVPAVL